MAHKLGDKLEPSPAARAESVAMWVIGLLFFGLVFVWFVSWVTPEREARTPGTRMTTPQREIPQRRATQQRKERAAELGRVRLAEEIQKLVADPCGTQLKAVDLPFLGWQLTCSGCAGADATLLLPQSVLDDARREGIKEIPLRTALELAGDC